MTVAVVALLAACPFPEPTSRRSEPVRDNKLVSKPVTIAELAPATGSVLVTTRDGLARVPLDGTRVTIIDTIPGAMTPDGAIRIHRSGGRYRVRTDNDELEVPDLVATDIGFLMAPDGRHVATAAETADGVRLAIISIGDATGRTFPLAMDKVWLHRWADDGSALFHRLDGHDAWHRVDVATGAVTEARPPVRTPPPDGSASCPEKGFRIRVDYRAKRQRIVIDPTATQANPEELSGVRPRILVEAENRSFFERGPNPGQITGLKVIKPCDHFMFDFGGWVYLGEVATGRFAPLIRGSDAR